MYTATYNQLIRHVRARTPLLNLVLDCERLVDGIIPMETAKNGIAELALNLKRSAAGPPVVCLSSDSVHGLSPAPSVTARLSTKATDALSKFIGDHGDTSAADLLDDTLDGGGMSPITRLYRDIRQKAKSGSRVLLLVSDLDCEDLRTIRTLLTHAKTESTATVVVITTDAIEHATLRTYMPVLIAERPSREELAIVFTRQLSELQGGAVDKPEIYVNGDDKPSKPSVVADVCAGSLSGLHIPTAVQILNLHLESPSCQVREKGEDGKNTGRVSFRIDPVELSREKAEVLNKAGYVTLINDLVNESEVGGLDELKKWLKQRRFGFTDAAKAQRMRSPRGTLLVGPPGTAKSMCAKLAASLFDMPLIRLDVGALFNSKLGSSERNVRNALQVADASSPCVLLLDEIDKSLGGMGGGESDGGTSSRLRGSILTWLADKANDVFVIATANSVAGLPPEMTRRGRFDEVWYVALPSADERESIWSIHLGKVDQAQGMVAADLKRLAAASDGFSGAEIEQAVHDSMYDNYKECEKLKLTAAMIEASLSLMTPLAQARRVELGRLSMWADANARHASMPQTAFHEVMDGKSQKGADTEDGGIVF